MVYIGIDLHRKRSQVAALDGNGELLFNRRVATRADELFKAIGAAGGEPVEVVFEATFGWGWLADMLAEAGIPTHMAHPLATKAISSARVKNDSVDAKTLAHLLRTNLLPEAWLAPPPAREARRLVRMRAGLVRIRTKLKNQIHAVLGEHGVEVEMSDLFGGAGRRLLAELRLPVISQQRLEACLRLIDQVSEEVAVADQQLKALLGQDARVARLLPIPGIGITIAATIVAEVWDVSRFETPDQLCSWAGLTPSERTSADNVRRGHISKQGSRWLRWVMVEAAIHALRDPELRQFCLRIARRRGPKIARVAVARRLLTLAYYALRSETGCRSYPLPSSPSVEARSLAVMASH
jgi:transposase